jgi:hypothetical protein
MFGVELIVPFFIIGPPAMKYAAAILFILLMVLIQLTGNYGFFNLLGIALSFLLLDDTLFLPTFHWLFPHHADVLVVGQAPAAFTGLGYGVAAIVLVLSLRPVLRLFRVEIDWPKRLEPLMEFLESLRLVNSYGLFSVMTTERPEIIVEGSEDGDVWRAYGFKWKPNESRDALRFVAPHQPRLDWQMWFAALGYYQNHPWFSRFLRSLLEGSPEVLALLKTNPFSGTKPRFIRAVIYDYRFTNRAERRAGAGWWKREWRGMYSPVFGRKET